MSQMNLGITIDLTSEEAAKLVRQFAGDIKALRKAVQEFNAQNKKGESASKQATKATEAQAVANKKLDQELKKVRNGIGQMVNQQKKTVTVTRSNTKAINEQSSALNRTEKSTRQATQATTGFGAALSALGLGYLTKQLISTNMQMEGTVKTLNYVAGSAEGGAKMFAFVQKEADRLGLEFNALVKNYALLSAATKDMVGGSDLAKDLLLAGSEAAVVFGMSTDDLNGTMRAFIQMLSKGNVQAEELRGQLGERLVNAFAEAAKAMGLTTQQLNKQLELGNVLAADLLPKLAEQLRAKFAPALADATQTVRAELNRMTNEFILAQTNLGGSGFMDGFTKGVKGLRKELGDMREDGSLAELGETMGTIATLAVDNADHLANLATAYVAYRVAAIAAATATNLFTGALMKNPVGILAAGLGALTFGIMEYRDATKDAAKETEKLAGALEKVTVASAEKRLGDLKVQLDEKQTELAELYDEHGYDATGGMIAKVTTDIKRLLNQIENAKASIKELKDEVANASGARSSEIDAVFITPSPADIKYLEKLQEEYEKLKLAIDPVYAAQQRQAEGMAMLWEMYDLGYISGSELTEMYEKLQLSLDDTSIKTKKLTEDEKRLQQIRERYNKGQFDNVSAAISAALDGGLDAGVKKFWKSWQDLGKKTVADVMAHMITTGQLPDDLGPMGEAIFGGKDAPMLKELKKIGTDFKGGLDDLGAAIGFGTKDKDGNLKEGKVIAETLSDTLGKMFEGAAFGATVGSFVPGGSSTGGAAGAVIGEMIGGPLGKLAGAIIGSAVVGAFKKTKRTSVDLSGGDVVQLSDYYAQGGANINAASSMAGAAAANLDQLMFLSGGSLAGDIGSLGVRKDKPFFDKTGNNGKKKRDRRTFDTPEEAIFAAVQYALAFNASGMGATFQTIRQNSRATTAEGLVSDFQFGRAYDEMLATDPAITQMESSIRQLKQQFNDAAQKARQLGLSEEKLAGVRQKILDHMKTSFDRDIEIQLLNFTDPFQAALKEQIRAQEKLLREAYAVGADMDQVYALIDAQRKDLIKSFEEDAAATFKNLTLSVDDFVQSLMGGSSSRFSRADTLSSATGYFNETLTAANDNDPDALNRIIKAADDRINAAFELYGSTAEAFAIQRETIAALEAIKANTNLSGGFGTEGDITAVLDANPTPTLTAELMQQVDQNITISNDILAGISDQVGEILDEMRKGNDNNPPAGGGGSNPEGIGGGTRRNTFTEYDGVVHA